MSNSVLLLLCFASIGHAIWNALSRGVSGRDQFYTLIIIIAAIVYSPIAIYLLFTTRIPFTILGWIVGSLLFEIVYFFCLAKAYKRGDFLIVYPVARGSAPLITTAFSFLIYGKSVGYVALTGIIMVVLGILFINQTRFSVEQFRIILTSHGMRWALLTGLCTAGYSVCDSMGAIAMSPILFKYIVFVGLCIGKLSIDRFSLQKHSYLTILKKYPYRTVVCGILVFGVNAIVIYTMQSTPVSLVATARELSIMFASIIGVLWLKEKLTPPKIIAISFIVSGVLLIRG